MTSAAAKKRARWAELWTLWRATFVSIAATAVEIVVLHFLARVIPKWVAFASVQVIANTATFLSYKYWAFDAANKGSVGRQYARQIAVFSGSWLLNTGIPSVFHYSLGLRPELAFAISNALVYLGWNYPLNRFWVFGDRHHHPATH